MPGEQSLGHLTSVFSFVSFSLPPLSSYNTFAYK